MNDTKKYLSGKEILLICPKFFNYHTFIIDELKSKGAIVQYVPEIEERLIFKFLRRIKKEKLQLFYDRYYLKSIPWRKNFDIVFVIKGAGLSLELLRRLRISSPNGLFLHYRWDSVKNFDNLYMQKVFHRTYSFDKPDCNKYGFIYKPLFYSPSYYNTDFNDNPSFKYDIMFVGTATEERIRFFKELSPIFIDNKLMPYIKLYCGRLRYLKFMLKSLDTTYLTVYPIKDDTILEIMRETKTILDLPSSDQNGLTMRSFEALGYGRMLITTNSLIKQEPFYNPEQILVISNHHFSIFFNFSTLTKFSFKPMKQFSLENWLKGILLNND